MNGQFIVTEQLREYCIQNNIDLALVQEPPIRGARIPGLDHNPIRTIVGSDSRPGSAIVLFNLDIEVLRIDFLSETNFTVVSVKQKNQKSINFVSAYFKFSIPILNKITKLRNILASLRTDTVIGMDSNAHSDLWFSPGYNNTGRAKGRKIVDMIRDTLLVVHNTANNPNTYARTEMGTSNIDVTLSTGDLEHNVRNWNVITEVTDSDHRLIRFDVLAGYDEVRAESRERKRFNVSKADWDSFKLYLTMNMTEEHGEGSIDEMALSIVIH
jgi:hypothetical protein